MWYRFAVAIILSNPVPGGFWVGDRFIDYGETFKLIELQKLLQTHPSNIRTQEKLDSFLSNSDRFEIINGNKIYLRSPRGRSKGLVIPFDFYIGEEKIQKGKVFGISELKKLLQTNYVNVNSQETLNSFLSNIDRFETIDGKKIYLRNTRADRKNLIIPFDFYIGEEKIQKGDIYFADLLRKLLQTDYLHVKTQEALNSFLSNSDRFEIIDGKKIYLRNTTKDRKNLMIPFDFYIGEQKIQKDQVFGIKKLEKLLQTRPTNINTQEKLNYFLNNSEFRINENGNNQYFPFKGSAREKYINRNLNITNDHNITVESQKPITILNPRKSLRILRLDFAFVRDKDILLAIEINGGQHYGFAAFSKNSTYEDWQAGLKRDVEKINYCNNNNIPLLIFNHLLPEQYFRTITNNLNKNPYMYDSYIPQSVIVNDEFNDIADMSLEFIRKQIYSHLHPVFNGILNFDDDISKKRYIKDTLILIAKLLGIYNGGIDKTDYIRAFDANVDLTENYNICLDLYNNLYPDYPLDYENKITYNDLSVKPEINKLKTKQIEENLIPSGEFKGKDNVV